MTLQPVRFDQEAAEAAAYELLVTAESIVEALSVLELDRPVVTEDWQGRFRTTFDTRLQVTMAGGVFLADLLQQMAVVIRARAIEAAAAQQAYEKAEEEADEEAPEGGP